MTFAEQLEEVYLITNRRDLEAETKSAIKAATLKAHHSDFYSKDIFETGVEFSSSSYRQSLDYVTLYSNFRAFKYVRVVTGEDDDLGTTIEIITPEEVLDSYGCNRNDIAYVAGRVLEIRSSTSFTKILIGAYVLPIVREVDYLSWVAEQHPFAIVYEAARVVFKAIGYSEQSTAFSRLAAEEFGLLRMSALSDVGY